MRPSDITDGIQGNRFRDRGTGSHDASMRPSDITDGITPRGVASDLPRRFNEAVGYYRRNRGGASAGPRLW